ncbi:HAD family hydrolase [Vibrio salinus]|uniref:HAD family hydrolase n=1 Tax=Vibrio salinus TaxID=2899784 RepID=UPI001E5E781F|nr:HAD-IA family hydrolase [Vibrio salinus]MCE0494491.1 HAD-IA family hydrolase [Vibrio salinus]
MTGKKELFVFDMDGVLLDSEPYWRRAQIDLLSRFGVIITEKDCIRYTMGKRIDDISEFWIVRFHLDVSRSHFAEQLLNMTAALIRTHAEARKGIDQLIGFLQHHGFRIALATSSSRPIISAVLNKLGLNDVFELTLSADSVENGKPAPDIYLDVCHQLKVEPENAFALEDSLTGVTAAVRAGVTTIAIPEKVTPEFYIASHQVSDIEDVIDVISGYIK